jgi:hypothetical protein
MSLIIKKNTTFKIPRTGSGAPSGLPYSSTNSINLVDASYPDQNGNYPKVTGYSNFIDDSGTITTNQFGITYGSGPATFTYYFVFNVTTNRWEFGTYEDSFGEGTIVWSPAPYPTYATNPSTNQNFIPTSGWSRNIVITAGA